MPLSTCRRLMRKKNQKTLVPLSRQITSSGQRNPHELKLDACKVRGKQGIVCAFGQATSEVTAGQKGHDAKPKRKRKMQIAFRSHYGGAAIFPVSVGDWGMQRYCTIPSQLSPLPSDTTSQLTIQASSCSTPLVHYTPMT